MGLGHVRLQQDQEMARFDTPDGHMETEDTAGPSEMRTCKTGAVPCLMFTLTISTITGVIVATGMPRATSSQRPNYVPAKVRKPTACSYTIIETFSHNADHFTQGITWHDGVLFESAGLYGKSTINIIELGKVRPIKQTHLQADRFAEGTTWFQNKILQLTWKEDVLIEYDPVTLQQIHIVPGVNQLFSTHQGWGLTDNGTHLFASDGSNQIYVLDAWDLELASFLPIFFSTTSFLPSFTQHPPQSWAS